MFTFVRNCKVLSGRKQKCKVLLGQSHKKCKVFLGRVTICDLCEILCVPCGKRNRYTFFIFHALEMKNR